MPYTDLPLDELRTYRPDLDVPDDLEQSWSATLEAARRHPIGATFEPVEAGLSLIDVHDVSFAGYGGSRIRAWLRLPKAADGPLPTVVEYTGYGGGRGAPHRDLLFPSAGFAHLLMDARGQGAMWGGGDTPDPDATGDSRVDGVMTDGILDPDTYYYRRLMTDAVRAIEAAREHPRVDPDRIAVVGASQGGGLALSAAGLAEGVRAVVADVPFLCDFPRAIRIADEAPYTQIVRYLRVYRDRVERVQRTLAYHDGAILGRRARAPALFSVALMDRVCPPSTVYAAYSWYGGPKEIVEYEFNDHEGGQEHHAAVRLAWLRDRLTPGADGGTRPTP